MKLSKLPVLREDVRCGECGAAMVRRWSKHGFFFGCSRFPECTGSHGCHQNTGEPFGVLANKETKQWRMKAHKLFDKLWKGDAHISHFDMEQCKKLIEILSRYRNEEVV